MRIALLTLGSRGDVQPFAALGRGLAAVGYRVRLVTGRGFDDLAVGLEYADAGVDYAAMMRDPAVMAALRSPTAMLRLWRSAAGLIRASLDGCSDAMDGVDAVIWHPKAIAGPHLAEAHAIPGLAAALQPILTPTAAFPSPLIPATDLGAWGNRLSHRLIQRVSATGGFPKVLAGWRRERLGLPGKPPQPTDLLTVAGRLVPRIHGYSGVLVPPPPDWTALDHVTGPWFDPPATDWTPPDALGRFLADGPPPVYVGFGSMVTGAAEEKGRMVVDALARAGLRGVIATGWGGLSAVAGPTIHVLEQAPHSWLFPRCAALIHHGGAGTTQEGLRWGRPTLICPVFGDQPFWGRRVAALGAGPAPIPQAKLTADGLAAALRVLVGDPAHLARASALGAGIRAVDGVGAAVAVIKGVLGDPR